jgi:heptaprenyl diphosphate synthase
MQSQNKITQETIIKSGLLLFAIAMNTLELFIPRIPFFPWLKPGLANIITLVWIIRYSFVDTLLFITLRIWILSFYFGFSFITFTLGYSGAVFSCCSMTLCWNLFGKKKILGTIGIAIIGAVFHNTGQLLAVYFLMAQNTHLFYQVPLMLFASVLFGGIVGFLVPVFLKMISEISYKKYGDKIKVPELNKIIFPHILISLILVLLCIILIFIDNTYFLLISAVSITIFVQYLVKGSFSFLFLPLRRFWLMFLFIGTLNLFFTYGENIYPFLPVTYEGIDKTLTLWVKLWTWLQTSTVFYHYKFHIFLFQGLQKIFSQYRSTLLAGLLAAEYFPAVIDIVRSDSKKLLKILFVKPMYVLHNIYLEIMKFIITQQENN